MATPENSERGPFPDGNRLRGRWELVKSRYSFKKHQREVAKKKKKEKKRERKLEKGGEPPEGTSEKSEDMEIR